MIKSDLFTYKNVHPDFMWNQQRMSKVELLKQARVYAYSEELYLKDIGNFLQAWFNADSLIDVQTSGSTGTPKIIRVKKQQMVNSSIATSHFFKLPAQTTALLCLPVTYIAGKLMIVRALVLGWHIDSIKPQANPLEVQQKTYDFCALTPYQLDKSFADLELVKKIIVGGGAVPKTLKKRVQNLSTQVYETYGMTETLTHIAARPINSKTSNSNPPFKVLEGVEINHDLRNCLVIKAPRISDTTIYTNDIVELINKKEFHLKGRFDNIINSGGIKIQPEEVERKLQNLIAKRFFITGLPDDTLGEKLVLFIEDQYTESKLRVLKKNISNLNNIDKYESPKAIYFVNSFAETHSGKVRRKKTVEIKLDSKF